MPEIHGCANLLKATWSLNYEAKSVKVFFGLPEMNIFPIAFNFVSNVSVLSLYGWKQLLGLLLNAFPVPHD